jgi:HEAT repeat protein
MLERLRDGRGAGYTDALATVIPKLDGDARRKAREALADRLTRMKAETLGQYMQDEDAEIRRAAALAAGMKDSKPLIPHLIRLLADREATVARAAHASLKELSGEDFGPRPEATRQQRALAIAAWQRWWAQQN